MGQQANDQDVVDPDEDLEDEAGTGGEAGDDKNKAGAEGASGADKDGAGSGGDQEMTPEELKEELETVRIALKRANRESAKRRLELKQLKESASKKPEGSGEEDKAVAKLQAEYDKVQAQLAALQTENASLKLRGTIRSKAAELKLPFYSEEALDDAVVRIQASLDEEYDDEDLVAAIKQVAKARPYLFRKADASAGAGGGSGTDAAKKGSSDTIVTAEEEAEVARRFNIKT